MKRRIISVLLSLVIAVVFMPTISFAVSTPSLDVTGIESSGEIKPGTEITATLNLPLSEAVGAAMVEMDFDSSVLEVTGISTTGVGSGGLSAITPKDAANENGMVRFAFASASGVEFGSTFALKVTFKVKEDAVNGSVKNLISVDSKNGYDFEDASQNQISIGKLNKNCYSAKVVSGTAQSNNQGGTAVIGGGQTAVNQTKEDDQKTESTAESESTASEVSSENTQETATSTEEATVTDASSIKNTKIIKGVQNTTVSAKSTKTSKGIKLTWSKKGSYKVDYYQIYRSTKKNSGYKKVYTTKSGNTKSYTNTKSLKKGTTYYYKVRGVRTVDGKKYYTEWSKKTTKKW